MGRVELCYECNEPLTEQTRSKDHIPPSSFFSEGEKINLITVPCCKGCNGGHSEEDSALMFLIFDGKNKKIRSLDLLKRTMKTLTKGSIRGSRPYLENLVANFEAGHLDQPGFDLVKIGVSRKAALSRMTRGLLYKFWGLRGFSRYQFTVFEIEEEAREALLEMLKQAVKSRQFDRGNGVFRADCLPDPVDPRSGLFCFQFFQGSVHCVAYNGHERLGGLAALNSFTFADVIDIVFPSFVIRWPPGARGSDIGLQGE